MIFVTAQPESLAVAAGRLQEIGSTLASQNGGHCSPDVATFPPSPPGDGSGRSRCGLATEATGIAAPMAQDVINDVLSTSSAIEVARRMTVEKYAGVPLQDAGDGQRPGGQQISDGSRLWVYRSRYPGSRSRKDAAPDDRFRCAEFLGSLRLGKRKFAEVLSAWAL